jgi:hypothetical protein
MAREHCEAIARRTGLPPICGACNLGPCPNWVEPLNERGRALFKAIKEIQLHAVRRQAEGGDLYDFQDTLRQCADMARAALRSVAA